MLQSTSRTTRITAALFALFFLSMPAAHAQGYAPAVNASHLMGMRFYPSNGSFMLESRGGVISSVGSNQTDATWQFFSQDLRTPDRHPFTLNDLQSRDGTYTVTVLGDGQPVKAFAFRVEDGQVVPHAHSALPRSPDPDFLTPRALVFRPRTNTPTGTAELFWAEAR